MTAAAATMTTVAADAAIIAASVSAYSTYQQGKYAEQMGEYNLQAAQSEAESAEVSSEYETRKKQIEGRKLLARQLVSYAKGGVVPSAGTPLKMQEQTAVDIRRDIEETRYGYQLYGKQVLSRGYMDKWYGKQQKRASLWSAGATALSGAGTALYYGQNS